MGKSTATCFLGITDRQRVRLAIRRVYCRSYGWIDVTSPRTCSWLITSKTMAFDTDLHVFFFFFSRGRTETEESNPPPVNSGRFKRYEYKFPTRLLFLVHIT
jgi:hypothetical protein